MRLPNTRHEIFSQRVASGAPASRAYAAAGYTARGNSAEANASRLLRDAKVRARVAELLDESAKEFSITKALLTLMLLEDRRVAHERGQAAAAGAITERLGKLHGFSFDPNKDGGPAAAPMKADEHMIDFKAANERYRVE